MKFKVRNPFISALWLTAIILVGAATVRVFESDASPLWASYVAHALFIGTAFVFLWSLRLVADDG